MTNQQDTKISKTVLSEWAFRIVTLFLIPFFIWLALATYNNTTELKLSSLEHQRDLLQMEQRIRDMEPDQEFIDRISWLESCVRNLELDRECR